MRLLVTTMPSGSHLMHLVPLATAAVVAGHDVLVATAGQALNTAERSGLTAVDVERGADCAAPYEALVARLGASPAGIRMPNAPLMDLYGEVFGEVGVRMMDGLLEVADAWRPDAVVYPGIHAAGLLLARTYGMCSVLHGIGTARPTFEPATTHILRARPDLAAGAATAHSGQGDADIEIDTAPASLGTQVHGAPVPTRRPVVLPMRYLARSVGAQLPRWVLAPRRRRRVVVTLGSMPPLSADGSVYRAMIEATDPDVELVFTTDRSHLPAGLPDRVRVEPWIPLLDVLRRSDAVVNHGGMGSIFAAFLAGVPQVNVPRGGMDCEVNAQLVAERGAGTTVDLQDADPVSLRRSVDAVLGDPVHRIAAQELQAEIEAMPSPAGVIAPLADAVQAHGALASTDPEVQA